MAKKKVSVVCDELSGKELYEAFLKYMENGLYQEAYDCLTHLYAEYGRRIRNVVTAFRSTIKDVVAEGGADAEPCYEMLHNAYLMTSQDSFDDFMIAVEWFRPAQEKFWLPRREKLLQICDAMQALADNELDELFVSQPPRTGKSTLANFFSIWLMGRDSEKSNLYTSYTESVVKAFYNGIMEILADPVTYDVIGCFPKFKIANTDAKDLLMNIGRKKRYASLTCRSLYGTLNGAVDCNGVLVMDDLHSGIEEALNKDLLAKAWMRIENNVIPRSKEGSKRLWIGTRWSLADCIARRIDTLENDPKMASVRYKIVNVPALDDNDESNFDYMFNLGFSTEIYHQRRASFERSGDSASWQAQYMGLPIERDGSLFAPDEMRYYNGNLPEGLDPDRIFMAVDPAWGGGDYVASPIIYQYGDDLFVHDVVFDNGDKTVTQPKLAQKALDNGVQAMYVEATKMTEDYASGIDTIIRKAGKRINLQTTHKHWSGTGKEQRIFDKAPDIRSRMIFLDSGYRSREYELFMQNVFSFTIVGKNKHDDAPDSLAMAIDMTENMGARATILRRMF